MTLRAKLLTSIAAFTLVLALLIVGVLAVKEATVPITGNIVFQAEDVNVEITGTLSNATTAHSFTMLKYDANNTPGSEALDTWKNVKIDFKNQASNSITFAITVTNKDDTREMYASVSSTVLSGLSSNANNCTATIKTGAGAYTWGSEVDITKGASVTFTITFAIGTRNKSVNVPSWQTDVKIWSPQSDQASA